MTTLRVTAVQPQLRIGEVDENLRRCDDLVRKAAADTAPDLIVLPEAVTSPNVYHPSLRSAPTPVDGPAYQLFCGLARELGCAVGAGYHSVRAAGNGDRDAHHTYVLAEPGGAAHLHDKDQPSVWENCYYVGGSDDGVMATSFGPIGCVLGFEANRSRTATRLRAGGVRLVIGGECLPSYPALADPQGLPAQGTGLLLAVGQGDRPGPGPGGRRSGGPRLPCRRRPHAHPDDAGRAVAHQPDGRDADRRAGRARAGPDGGR